jgi:tRNA dimethylallyltransferase
MGKAPLVVIVGPTGVGKTAVAVQLAQALNGEIVSADSRQVYRRMDIGTAKPTPEECRLAPHHLIDILEPDEELTVEDFQIRAYSVIEHIQAKGKLPLLVGGSGQYIRAVVEGWVIPRVPPQPALRVDLETFADVYGATALHARLTKFDPVAAASIDWRNVRRVVRALEVYMTTGQPITVLQARRAPLYRTLKIGLTRPRQLLYNRVDVRIDQMMADGLLDEVRSLTESGYEWGLPSMSSLGYAQLGSYLQGEITLEQAIALIRRETRRFIRQQYTWFRLDDPSITWFDLEVTPISLIIDTVKHWLAEG